jgi:hypothetical protein
VGVNPRARAAKARRPTSAPEQRRLLRCLCGSRRSIKPDNEREFGYFAAILANYDILGEALAVDFQHATQGGNVLAAFEIKAV